MLDQKCVRGLANDRRTDTDQDLRYGGMHSGAVVEIDRGPSIGKNHLEQGLSLFEAAAPFEHDAPIF